MPVEECTASFHTKKCKIIATHEFVSPASQISKSSKNGWCFISGNVKNEHHSQLEVRQEEQLLLASINFFA
jgi:hypothetical protein